MILADQNLGFTVVSDAAHYPQTACRSFCDQERPAVRQSSAARKQWFARPALDAGGACAAAPP
jgi:hypothetical protein